MSTSWPQTGIWGKPVIYPSVRRLLGVLLRAFLFGTQNSEVETNRSIAGTRKQLSGRLLLVHPARLERATP